MLNIELGLEDTFLGLGEFLFLKRNYFYKYMIRMHIGKFMFSVFTLKLLVMFVSSSGLLGHHVF